MTTTRRLPADRRVDAAATAAVARSCQALSGRAWALLEELVNTDSFPDDAAGLDRVVAIMEPYWAELGFRTAVSRTAAGLPVLVGDRPAARDDAPRVLLLSHLDTVFPPGTTVERPFTVADGRAHGPGVADMKGGAVVSWMAAAAALETGAGLPGVHLRVLNNTDEEAGSVESRPLIEAEAPAVDLALVFEPGRPDGSMVTRRRGLRRYRITVTGKPAHTGVEPWNGINANEALAHKVLALQQLNDRERNLSVTASLVRGGSRINIVPHEAVVDVDVRIPDLAVAAEAHERIEAIVAREDVPGARARYEIFGDRPPMVPGEGVDRVLPLLLDAAEQLGVELPVTATGGGSDGSFLSALGVPVLDALGPVGGGYHTPEEFFRCETLEQRAAAVGALLVALDGDGDR